MESLAAHHLSGLRASRISVQMVAVTESLGHSANQMEAFYGETVSNSHGSVLRKMSSLYFKHMKGNRNRLRHSRENGNIPRDLSSWRWHVHHETVKLNMIKEVNDKQVFMG